MRRIDDAEALQALRESVTLAATDARWDWMTRGSPALGLFDGGRNHLATLRLSVPYIACDEVISAWALLAEPMRICEWLVRHELPHDDCPAAPLPPRSEPWGE